MSEDQRAAKGSPRYRRALIALFCAGVATFAQVYSPQALLPHIAADFRLSESASSLAIGATTIGLALGMLPWGRLSDRIGRVRAMRDYGGVTFVELHEDGTTLQVVAEGTKLVNLERYQSFRDRFRGTLKTHSIGDFARYVEKHPAECFAPAGFIDQDRMSCSVIFNLGNEAEAGHGDDTATLTLKPTAAYSAVQAVAGQKRSQQDLAEWLEDWAPHLQAYADNEPLNIVQAVAGIRKMTIKATSQRDSNVGDFSASRSAMDEIEARSQETLPTRFEFKTAPFEGLQEATINLRLSVITGSDAPILKLRWVGEEAQRESFAHEFKAVLEREVGGFVPLTIGTFSLGE